MIGANIYAYIVLIFIFTFVMGGFITMFGNRDNDNDEQ